MMPSRKRRGLWELIEVHRYTFFEEKTRLYGQPAGIDELDAHASGILSHPLTFEPGTDWAYGVS